MPQGSFAVMVAGQVSDDKRVYVEQYLERMMKMSRLNDGCLVYNVHQCISNPCEFMMYSEWVDQDSFEKHNAQPEMQEFIDELASVMFDVRSPKTFWRVLPG